MPLSNPFPGHSALATFADLRRDLEGAVVRNAAGVMRAGVFPAHFNPLVTGRTDMRVNIADFRAVQNRGGAVFLANTGTDTSVILDAAPGANRRIDLIYVTMQSATLGDPASAPLFGVVKGTVSPTPVVPSLPPNVADAIRLATAEIPAGATTTLSAGVVITQLYPYTAMAGGTVVVRNSVELSAWTPADGAKAYNVADSSEYVRTGGEWKKAAAKPKHVEYSFSRVSFSSGEINVFTTAARPTETSDTAFTTLPADTGRTVTVNQDGLYAISFYGALGAASTGRSFVEIGLSGRRLDRAAIPNAEDSATASTPAVRITSGSNVTFTAYKTSSITSTFSGVVALTRIGDF